MHHHKWLIIHSSAPLDRMGRTAAPFNPQHSNITWISVLRGYAGGESNFQAAVNSFSCDPRHSPQWQVLSIRQIIAVDKQVGHSVVARARPCMLPWPTELRTEWISLGTLDVEGHRVIHRTAHDSDRQSRQQHDKCACAVSAEQVGMWPGAQV